MGEMRPSDKFSMMKWITLVLGIILGIICGSAYSVPVSVYQNKFNTGLMVIVWICTVICTMLFYAVSAHLKNQETIIDIMISEKNK